MVHRPSPHQQVYFTKFRDKKNDVRNKDRQRSSNLQDQDWGKECGWLRQLRIF